MAEYTAHYNIYSTPQYNVLHNSEHRFAGWENYLQPGCHLLWNPWSQADLSTVIQVHQDILRTIGHPDTVLCQVLDPTQQVGRITGQKKTCSIMYIYYCYNSYENQMQMCAKGLTYLKMLIHVIIYC